MSPTARKLPCLAPYLGFVLASVVFLIHARGYLPFFADDGFISLRYAQRLIEGHGLTWNDGERVEGYSNFLWVLACAGLGYLGLDLVNAARMLGQASGIATIAAVMVTYWPTEPGYRPAMPGFSAALVLALSGTLAVWSIGGLEQPLLAVCLAWGLFAVFRLLDRPDRLSNNINWTFAGIPFALICWTRPDGPLLPLTLAIGLVFALRLRAKQLSILAWFLLPSLVFILLQLVFRLSYYNAWIPNSASAKLAFTPQRWFEGGRYVLSALAPLKFLLVLACTAILPFRTDKAARRRLTVILPVALGWLTYCVLVGGDIFPARRQLLVPIVLASFAIAEGVRWLAARSQRVSICFGILVLGGLGLFARDQAFDPENERASKERWEWDGAVLGAFYQHHFGPMKARLATDSAGALPYFSRLTTIDMLGINDRSIATNRPKDFGRGALGHELGNGEYVLSQEPDLVTFGLPRGEREALYKSGIEMQSDPAFRKTYSLINFETSSPRTIRAQVWVRRESERLGVQRDPSNHKLIIPGFLLAVGRGVAREDGEGRLGAMLAPFAPGAIRVSGIPGGRWRVDLSASGTSAEIGLRWGNGSTHQGPAPLDFVMDDVDDVPLDLAVRPRGDGLVHVREVRMTRLK